MSKQKETICGKNREKKQIPILIIFTALLSILACGLPKKIEISESLKDFLLHQNASHNTAEQFCLCFSIRFIRVGILKKLWTSFLAKVKYQLYGS